MSAECEVKFVTYREVEYRISWETDDCMEFEADLKEFLSCGFEFTESVFGWWGDRGYYIS